jgi:hypothetical protein
MSFRKDDASDATAHPAQIVLDILGSQDGESKAALSSDSNMVPRICHFSRVTESVQEPGICTLPNIHKLDIFFCQCRMINIFKFEIPV